MTSGDQGQLPPPLSELDQERLASLRDVALLAGVSEATASRVLGETRKVGAERRERVLSAAAKLRYQPNPHARALARSRDPSIGIVVHDVTDPYFSEIVRGVLEEAEASGRITVICSTGRDAERELAYIRHFRAQRVEALLLAGSGRVDRTVGGRISAEVLSFERAGGRAVLIGRHHAVGDMVLPDNRGGGRQMADHLVGLGHRSIGVIAGPDELTTTQDRLEGFRERLDELGVTLPDDLVWPGAFDLESGEVATQALLDAVPSLTAIFALNDVMVIGALAALRRVGLRVPDDVSVAGFGDIPLAESLSPPLTTVRVPMAEIGRRALALAFSERSDGFRVDRLATRLVARATTARVPGRGR